MLALILLKATLILSDRVVDEAAGVTEVPCAYSFCDYCQSSESFQVNSIPFSVPGYLESSSKLLQQQISELSNYLQGNLTVSISESWLCIMLKNFESSPELPELYNSLLSTSLAEQHHIIESFSISLNQTFMSKSIRAGSSVSWEEIKIIYQDVESEIEEIEIKQITESVNRSYSFVYYEGTVSLTGGGSFVYTEKYVRDYYDPFKLNVTCEAVELSTVEQDNNCKSFVSPRGIESVHYLAPSTGLFSYFYDGSEFLLGKSEFIAWCPEFSVGEGVVLARGSAYLKIADGECYMEVRGSTDKKHLIKIELEENDFLVYLNVGNLTLTQLEEMIDTFYMDYYKLLPYYYDESESLDKIYKILAVNTSFYIRYNPETILNFTATGAVLELNDCTLSGHVERNDSVVESYLVIKDLTEPAINYILGASTEEGDIISTTIKTTIDSTEYSAGITIETKDMKGVLFPGDFYLSSPEDNIVISEHITVEEVKKIQFIDPYQAEYYTGEDYFVLGGSTMKFLLKLVQRPYGYYVESNLSSTWVAPFDLTNLEVPLFWIDFESANETVEYIETDGEANFSCEDLEDCWYGQAQIDYPDSILEEYSYSELLNMPESKSQLMLFLFMNPVESDVLFETLFHIDPTTLSQSFEFNSIVDLSINYEHYLIETKAFCFEISCNFTANFREEHPYIQAYLPKIELAHGNVQVLPSSGSSSISLSLEVSPGGLFGQLSGITEIWDISTNQSYEVNENNADTSLSGFIFQGIFNMTMDLTILIESEIQSAPVFILGYLQSEDLEELSKLVNEELEEWISKAEYVLDMSQEISEEYTYQESLPECLCLQDRICYSSENRTLETYAYGMNCSTASSACESVEIYCTRDTTYCMEQEVKCTEWYKNIPNTCKTTTTTCVKELDICMDWYEVCYNEEPASCAEYTINSVENYEKKDYSCEIWSIDNLECESQCIHQDNVQDYRDDLTATVTEADQEINEKLEGFSYLTNATLFKLIEAKLDIELDSTGIGSNDLILILKAEIYSIASNEPQIFTTELHWDFFNKNADVKKLYDWARSIIISESEDSLDEELNSRSALELYYEGYNQ